MLITFTHATPATVNLLLSLFCLYTNFFCNSPHWFCRRLPTVDLSWNIPTHAYWLANAIEMCTKQTHKRACFKPPSSPHNKVNAHAWHANYIFRVERVKITRHTTYATNINWTYPNFKCFIHITWTNVEGPWTAACTTGSTCGKGHLSWNSEWLIPLLFRQKCQCASPANGDRADKYVQNMK